MRAFVTGGTGLLGRPLVETLQEDGWEVTVLTRDPARAKDLEARGVQIVEGDVTRPRFNASFARADVVFHVAGLYEVGLREFRRMIDVNVTGTANVLAAARRENVGRVVFTSTAGVFAPTPRDRPVTESAPVQTALPDPYVTSKVQAHQLAVAEMRAGLPLTIVLPAAVFGPGDTGQLGRTLALLARGRLPRLPRGFGVNTWTHAADIARGHVLAAPRGPDSRDDGVVRRHVPDSPGAVAGQAKHCIRLRALSRNRRIVRRGWMARGNRDHGRLGDPHALTRRIRIAAPAVAKSVPTTP